MKKILCILLAVSMIPSCVPLCVSAKEYKSSDYVEGEVIFKYEPPLTFSSVSAEKTFSQKLTEAGISSVREVECYDTDFSLSSITEQSGIFVAKTENVETACENLEKINGVEYAEPNYLLKTCDFSAPSELTSSYDYIDNQSWYFDDVLKIPSAWEEFQTAGDGVTVAVIDNGFYLDAMDYPVNLWDDGNGNHGWNVANNSADLSPVMYLNGKAVENSFHGTHTSSTIGMAANGFGGIGVAYNSELMLIRVSNDYNEMPVSALVSALHYAANNGADVINMSLGGAYSSAEKDAIDYAYGKGCVIVAAAGNDGKSSSLEPSYPAAFDNVIGVMASERRKMSQLASFSNYGELYDVAVPGVDISGSTTNSTDLVQKRGTSMASPIVSGLASLYISSKKSCTNEQVYDAFRNSSSMLVRSNSSVVKNEVLYFDLPDAMSLLHYDGTSSQNKNGLYLDSNGGVGITVKPLNEGEKIGSLPTPVRKGYCFDGWHTSSNGGEKITENTVFDENQSVIYAHWSANNYTVTLNSDGGTFDLSTVSLQYDDDYWKLPVPEKDGFYFIGWYTDAQFKNPAKVNNFGTYNFYSVKIARNHTVYARWASGKNIPVHFIDNATGQQFDDISVNFGEEYGTLPVLQDRNGYTFLGWYLNENSNEYYTENSLVEIPYEHTLYAIWKLNSYTVSFDANGGVCPENTITVNYGQFYPFEKMPIPTLEGMHFVGWYTADDSPAMECRFGKINFYPVTTPHDHILYAKWSDGKNVTVHFVDDFTKQEFDDLTVNYGEKYSLPIPDSISGFTFLGWSEYGNATNEFITDDTTVITACEHTLYAIWRYEGFVFNEESGLTYDSENKLLYGFDLENLNEAVLLSSFKNPNKSAVTAHGNIGTGTQIQLFDKSGNAYDSATIVIFGDVNGDGKTDSTDAVITLCMANGMLTSTDIAINTAADCNHDGSVDEFDAELMESAGLSLTQISQINEKITVESFNDNSEEHNIFSILKFLIKILISLFAKLKPSD